MGPGLDQFNERTAITAATVSIATAGLFTAYTTPKKVPIVPTTRRLLILGTRGIYNSPDSKIVGQPPRSDLRTMPPHRRFPWTKVVLTNQEGTPVGQMLFPLPSRAMRGW